MSGTDGCRVFPPERFRAKQAERERQQTGLALMIAQEKIPTIETYLDELVANRSISPKDKQLILTALAPVIRFVPLVEQWIIEMVRAEMVEPDADQDTPSNTPRARELADWNEALARKESLLPIPDFDFHATYRQFLVTIETDPKRTVTPLNAAAAADLRQTRYVPSKYEAAEKFFLFSLRILRFQSLFGTSQESLLENARAASRS